jgi:hypothetical protein
MLQSIFGILFTAVVIAVLVQGVRAARTRNLAIVGFLPSACALGAFGWALFARDTEHLMRIAQTTAAVAAGMAHSVIFSLVALPRRWVWMRILLSTVGMWAGTFLALWVVVPESNSMLTVLVTLLGSLTIAAWATLPIWSRDRGYIEQAGQKLPTVRFACPRCGTRVDWSQGIAACTDCGLFMHLLWPADALHQKQIDEGKPLHLGDPDRTVKFACPRCGHSTDWPCGDLTCSECGLKISIHWNAHKRVAP